MKKIKSTGGLLKAPYELHRTMIDLAQAQVRAAQEVSTALLIVERQSRSRGQIQSIIDNAENLYGLTKSGNFVTDLSKHGRLLEKARASLAFAEEKREELRRLASEYSKEYEVTMYMAMRFWPSRESKLVRYLARQEIKKNELDGAIYNYYKKNDWSELRKMVRLWKPLGLASSRRKILEDCLEAFVMLNASDINISNVVVPTLMCQFDGIIRDTEGVSKSPKDNVPMMSLSPAELSHNSVLFGIIFEIFKREDHFSKSKTEGTNPINIHRHKINHGDQILLDYGYPENVIRMFIYINEVAHFAFRNQLGENTG